jgi:hypothetical protein
MRRATHGSAAIAYRAYGVSPWVRGRNDNEAVSIRGRFSIRPRPARIRGLFVLALAVITVRVWLGAAPIGLGLSVYQWENLAGLLAPRRG